MHRHIPIQIQMNTADSPSSPSPPPPPPPPPPPLEQPKPPHPPPGSSPAPDNHPPPPTPNYGPPQISHAPPPYPPHPEWFSLFMNFCFAAFSIFVQSNQASTSTSGHHHQLPPLSFQMACLGLVFALAAFVVSKYMPENLGAQARFLENAGVFLGVTGFFIDITPFFHLSLKIISWTVYAISLITIIICRNFHIVMELIKEQNT